MKLWKFILCLLVIAVGCSSRDPRLVRVQEIVSDSPQKVLSMLDSIDRGSLNESDRSFYDLMEIKAKDKAYIKHVTDSVIIRLKEYYSKDKESDEYLEAVYYCGRVLSDIGDYPSAMKYYQNVIDITEDDTSRNRLVIRGNALSQLSGILIHLGMYDRALVYGEKLKREDEEQGDTLQLIESCRAVGSLYLRKNNLEEAEKNFKKAKALIPLNNKRLATRINIYLAGIEYKKDNDSVAWNIIKPCVESADTNARSIALTYACWIAYSLGKYDSAHLYAKKILQGYDDTNKIHAYKVLLRPQLASFETVDSIIGYSFRYGELVDKQVKRNEEYAALMQEVRYNYESHEREKEKAVEKNIQLVNYLKLSLVCALVFALLYSYQLIRKKDKMLRFYDAIMLVGTLKKKQDNVQLKKFLSLLSSHSQETVALHEEIIDLAATIDENHPEVRLLDLKTTPTTLRERLAKEILELEKSVTDKYIVPEEIAETTVFRELQDAINNKISIERNKEFWDRLEKMIEVASPGFIKNLVTLVGGRLKEADMQVALLIKCGVAPTEMTYLLNKEKGTIASRRTRLGVKAFDKKMSTTMVDKLIRLL